jgi:iron complex outermembrane receptor protein
VVEFLVTGVYQVVTEFGGGAGFGERVVSGVYEGSHTVRSLRYAVLAALLFGGWASMAAAEDAPPAATKSGNVEEIVVTGSYIKGSAQDAALPVDVVTSQDMKDQGSPNILELVRQLGVTSGNLGQTNQFQGIGQGNEGVVSINLRGLGASRTLTLINGRREVPTQSNGVDISIIPTSALERTEVLLGGAAATYGSDALAGVVNFITRSQFEGFELGASEQSVQGSNGNQQYNAIYGWGNDRMNFMIAGEYDHLAEISTRDRNWALVSFAKNPAGGWSSIANPGTYYQAIPTANNLPPPTADGRAATAGLLQIRDVTKRWGHLWSLACAGSSSRSSTTCRKKPTRRKCSQSSTTTSATRRSFTSKRCMRS